jgi:hypothetical protein
MNARDHNKLVGIFLMIHGGLQALIMVILSLVYGGVGAVLLTSAKREEEQMVGAIFIGAILFIVVLSVFFVIPQLLGGWKLIKEKPGARTWGIVGSIIALLSFPLGTAAGVYGLWFLFGEQGKQFYLGGAANPNLIGAPPPHNWQ